MKKTTVWISAVLALAFLIESVAGVFLIVSYYKEDVEEDFSFMCVEPVYRLLEVSSRDVAFEDYRDSGVLYLDTSGITQTDCRYLISQIIYFAKQHGLVVDSCSRNEAIEKGYLRTDPSDPNGMPIARNCVWIIINDRVDENGMIKADFCLYADSRAAYYGEITLTKEDGRWSISDVRGGLS